MDQSLPLRTDVLFRPISLNGLELKNRVVMAPMTRKMSPGGIPNADVVEYYRRRAEGGVGLIITEGTTINRQAASNDSGIPNFYDPDSLAGWAKVVAAVHAAGGRIAPQLWHQGLARPAGTGPYPDAPSEGPSATVPGSKAMTDEDIADTINAFATSAASAKKIGFDAVELHGAHGYLIDEFLWSGTNNRTDAYGGDAIARTRFATEIVKAVRAALGPNFPLIFRFSQWKAQNYDARLAETPQELEGLLAPLVDAGVDVFHASTRRFWQPEFDGSDLNLAGWTRKVTGLPTISVGSVSLGGEDFFGQLRGDSTGAPIASLDELVQRMNDDEFDMIAVGRAMISNPDWANLVHNGDTDQLRPFEKTMLATLD
ncbi:MAG: NADH:flavin oxidoreductase [Alphaproteobacteria bacterium]|nr:NADH:flavin oxidoreductase [Alphaproteobacteria bacterium]